MKQRCDPPEHLFRTNYGKVGNQECGFLTARGNSSRTFSQCKLFSLRSLGSVVKTLGNMCHPRGRSWVSEDLNPRFPAVPAYPITSPKRQQGIDPIGGSTVGVLKDGTPAYIVGDAQWIFFLNRFPERGTFEIAGNIMNLTHVCLARTLINIGRINIGRDYRF